MVVFGVGKSNISTEENIYQDSRGNFYFRNICLLFVSVNGDNFIFKAVASHGIILCVAHALPAGRPFNALL